MSMRNVVVWSDGLFIKPQHFQQAYRNQEYLINQRVLASQCYSYGFSNLSVNTESLSFGRISLSSASGVMPDGTVFDLPKESRLPNDFAVPDGVIDQVVYLAVHLEKEGAVDVTENFLDASGSRYWIDDIEVRDVSDAQGDFSVIRIGKIRTSLVLEKEDRSSYSYLAICKIMEKHTDGSVRLDKNFIPTVYNAQASEVIQRYLSELDGVIEKRISIIASRLGNPSQGGVADVSDFLILQVLNRYYLRLKHFMKRRWPHPEDVYLLFSDLVGDLSTFDEKRIPPANLPHYNHDLPKECFEALISVIKGYLNVDRSALAESLLIKEGRFGLYTIAVNDSSLLYSADFIFAVKADLSQDVLYKELRQRLKLSSVDNISRIIKLALSGIPLIQLAVAPHQLPFHAGYSYFKVDTNAEAYRAMSGSTGFAIHISGQIPGLKMEFWAIRG